MDDANVPSLLAMPYLGDVALDDPIYQNTRRFVLSEQNPFFFKGSAGEGIGGPHIGYDMVWPMSIMTVSYTHLIVSTSANVSGAPSPAHFGEISQEILEGVDYVVKYRQGDRRPATASSIIKLEVDGQFKVLR